MAVMTEADWMSCDDPEDMLDFLHGRAGKRRLRLFACACVRSVWHYLDDGRSIKAVEVAERYADGQATKAELAAAYKNATAAVEEKEGQEGNDSAYPEEWDPDLHAAYAAEAAAKPPLDPAECASWASNAEKDVYEEEVQAELLRDIVGNPWRPLPQRDFPAQIRVLAQEISDGNHDLFGLLGDYLKDIGEVEAAAHCRQDGHVRGCHLLDWVLGRYQPVPLDQIFDLHERARLQKLETLLGDARLGATLDSWRTSDPEFTHRLAAERGCEVMRVLDRSVVLPIDPRVRALVREMHEPGFGALARAAIRLRDLLRSSYPATMPGLLQFLTGRATKARRRHERVGNVVAAVMIGDDIGGHRNDPEVIRRLAKERGLRVVQLLRQYVVLPFDLRVSRLVQELNAVAYHERGPVVLKFIALLQEAFPDTPPAFFARLQDTALRVGRKKANRRHGPQADDAPRTPPEGPALVT